MGACSGQMMGWQTHRLLSPELEINIRNIEDGKWGVSRGWSGSRGALISGARRIYPHSAAVAVDDKALQI